MNPYSTQTLDTYQIRESGIYVPARFKRPYPTGVDLFAGCGGFSLGFIQAGYEIVGAVEWDMPAAHTYMVNLGACPMKIHFPEGIEGEKRFEKYLKKGYKRDGFDIDNLELKSKKLKKSAPVIAGSGWIEEERRSGNYFPGVKNFWLGDIRNVTGKEILDAAGLADGELDCVIGGPPCQGFTRANTKSGPDDPRNNFIFEYARLVLELNPKTFVMENVPEMATMRTPDGIPFLEALKTILADRDFASYEALSKAIGSGKGRVVFKGEQVLSEIKQKSKKPEPKKQIPEMEGLFA